ncbi:MAG TPA: succinylglutamate desuccinylase/aspartoacylase family protein [Syntrophomonadaceae bacterium]|nr:succinylglutamate desuccinylase/aspartoacylase family protein [Syntrophomonadaceae bacterium]HPR94478.1 succinylglutamate desuccinylase/aspartoacylase family protein [Syntrophomonadaceae bacterium]
MKKVRRNTYYFIVSFLSAVMILTAVYVNPAQVEAAAATRQNIVQETVASSSINSTEIYIIDSGKPGPVVMITGGVHGNETAGVKAASEYTDLTIKKGMLLVLPEANQNAVAIDRRIAEGGSDLNRSFPQTKSESADTILARAIYKIVKDYDVDWLMDMHEGIDYYKNTKTDSVGQTLIYYPSQQMTPMAKTIVNTVNKSILKSYYYKYSLLKYPVKGSLTRSSAQFLGVNAFIFETSQKQTLATRVNQQCIAADTLLKQLDMI